MNEDFEKLKEVGAQKIYEKTHIARKNVEYILSKSFDKIPKIQFRGFISILEREYHLDLSGLLAEFEAQSTPENDPLEPIVEEQESQKNYKVLLVAALVIIFVGGYLGLSSLTTNKSSDNMELNNSQIEAAKVQMEANNSDVNVTVAEPVIEQNATQPQEEPKELKATRLEIMTRQELWVGYIDLSDYSQKQITIKKDYELDPTKNYLIILGHGMVKVDLGTDVKEYREVKQKYFKFEDGELTELTRKEFKTLNKGRIW